MRTILGVFLALLLVLVVCLAFLLVCEQPRAPGAGDVALEKKEMMLNDEVTKDTGQLAILGSPTHFAVLLHGGAAVPADELNDICDVYEAQGPPNSAVAGREEVAINRRTCTDAFSGNGDSGMMITTASNAIGGKRRRAAY